MDPLVNALAASTADGELAGNWSWTVWLLIPVVLVLAVLTARALGSADDDPAAAPPRGGGVDRFLARTEDQAN
ncbi:MAG: hypothetical protein ACR2HP_11485 [Ilumatobacteraceae bacterium]